MQITHAALAALFSFLPLAQAPDGASAPQNLRVELQTAPVALDAASPRFTWEVVDVRRGARQSAWHVLVSKSENNLRAGKGEVWDSGQVASLSSAHAAYAGPALERGRAYFWCVRTYDAVGKPSPWSEPARFTLGPRAPEDWRGKWIRAGHAGGPGGIGWQSATQKKEDDWQWVQLDFGGDVRCDRVRLHPARPHGDAAQPGTLFPLRVRVYTDGTGTFDSQRTIQMAQYEWQDIPEAGVAPLDLEFTRFTLRYIRIVFTKLAPDGEHGFGAALGEIEVLDGGTNVAARAALTCSSSRDETGWSLAALNDGALLSGQGGGPVVDEALPRLVGSFVLYQETALARLHAAATGSYRLFVNGQLVSRAAIAPGWTSAGRATYQTFDVARHLDRGPNVIGVELAPGWADAWPPAAESARAEPCFAAQIDVVLEDGQRVSAQTGPDWRWSREGPLSSASPLRGVTRDERRAQPGWNEPQGDTGTWRPIEIVAGPMPRLAAERAPEVRVLEELEPVATRAIEPGTWGFDFGRVLSGVVRLRVRCEAESAIVVGHAESIGADGRLDRANQGGPTQVGAANEDRYRVAAGDHELEPRAALHGFRYVEVSGLAEAPLAVSAKECGAQVAELAQFRCSNEALNAAWDASGRTLRANLLAIPGASLQGDGRLGWCGPALAAAPALLARYDAVPLLSSWLADLRTEQAEDGRFPDLAPKPPALSEITRGTPGWADAGAHVAWDLWLATHDLRQLRSSVDPVRRWAEWIVSKNPELVWSAERGADRGDEGFLRMLPGAEDPCADCEVPKELYASAFLARSLSIAAKVAFANDEMERAQDVSLQAEAARAAFRDAFAEKDGKLAGDAQAGYALALDFELYESALQAEDWANRLAARVRKQGALTCGWQTAHRALLALSRHGHHALAVELVARDTVPSYGHMIARGGALAERWECDAGGSGSLAHLGRGALSTWLLRGVAGIEPLDRHVEYGPVTVYPEPDGTQRTNAEGPRAWERIALTPRPGPVTSLSATQRTIAGTISVSWTLRGKSLEYECTIPPGSFASLTLPAAGEVRESGQPLKVGPGITQVRPGRGVVRIELEAGRYAFQSEIP